MLAHTPGVEDLSLTTNGILLDKLSGPLVDAGLRRINVSLDSLSHTRFAEITRRDALDRVLAGLEEAERYPELRPIKVNCVAIRGFTEEEVPALAELARRKPYVIRFIEFMPLDADEAWRADEVLTGGEIRALIEERWPLVEIPAKPSSTARRFRFVDGLGEIGFVNPVSEPFCSSCDRIRLTADGRLRTCLFSRREWDLKGPLRRGSSDEELEGSLTLGRAAQGAQAPDQRTRIRPRVAVDESDRRMMNRTLVISLVLVASAAVVAAGCGGTSRNKAYSSSKTAYAAALDSICAATNKAGNSIDLSSTEKIASNGDDAKDLLDKLADKVDGLEPPDEVKTQAQSFADGLKQEANEFGDMVDAAKDGDTAKIKEIQGKLSSEGAATSEDARFIGATGCARLFS